MGLLTKHLHRQIASRTFRYPVSQTYHPTRCIYTTADHEIENTPEFNLLLTKYSQQPPRPLTLHKLLSFGSPLTQATILESASHALSEIPRRLVGRVRALEALPFIVTTNPFLSRALRTYKKSFEALATHPRVKSLEDNWEFTDKLEGLVSDHANDIPTMAKGFQECARYISSSDISLFLDDAIRARIGLRLIAEQHITLSHALREAGTEPLYNLGIVDMKCSPAQMVRMCSKYVADLCEATLGSAPSIIINGSVDATFAYVPVHLEFALTELLKNAFRATVEYHRRSENSLSKPLAPITITIASPPPDRITTGPPFLTIRIRDEGGGVSPTNLPLIFSYAFTTSGRDSEVGDTEDETGGGPYAAQHIGGSAAIGGDDFHGQSNLFGEITGKGLQTGMGTLSGLGYGLPLAKLYARYFGGDLQLVSLYNHGTDVFLKLRCLRKDDTTLIS